MAKGWVHFRKPKTRQTQPTHAKKKKKQKLSNDENNQNTERKSNKKAKIEVYDLWGKNESNVNEWVAPSLPKPLAKPKSVASQPTQIPSVELPRPGQSYNPDYDQHQELLGEAAAELIGKREQRKVINDRFAKEKSNSKKYKEGQHQGTLLPEVTSIQDLIKPLKTPKPEPSELDPDQKLDIKLDIKDIELKVHNPYSTKLTIAQRNKQKRHIRRMMRLKSKKLKKKKLHEWRHLPAIVRTVEEELAASREKSEHKKLVAQQQLSTTKKIGKWNFEPEALRSEVLLTEELPGSIRNLKAKDTLMMERYKSWQKRNLIPAAMPKVKRLQAAERHKAYRKLKKKWYESHPNRNFAQKFAF